MVGLIGWTVGRVDWFGLGWLVGWLVGWLADSGGLVGWLSWLSWLVGLDSLIC